MSDSHIIAALLAHVTSELCAFYLNYDQVKEYASFNGTIRQLAADILQRSKASFRSHANTSVDVDAVIREAEVYIDARTRNDPFNWIASCEDAFPTRLESVRRPPHVLTFMGNVALFANRSVAIVGARKACKSGLEASVALAHAFGSCNVTVVSGGAFGCDSASHRGALATVGSTISVMAGGLADLYPTRLRDLFMQIIESGGLIVSERLFPYRPRPKDFVIRNRIIAGLGDELVLIQANTRSGALITAQYAIELGKDVYAWQSDHEMDDSFLGNARLIEEGAGILRVSAPTNGSGRRSFELIEPGYRRP